MRIPLADGTFAYGRVLANPYVAFYDYRTGEPSPELDLIESKPLLFTLAVGRGWKDRWEKMGQRELSGDVAQPVVQFMQDLIDFRKCVIFDTDGMEREATPEECIGLEVAGVWEADHVEQRLLDRFMGRPNAEELRARVRLE